MKSLYLSKSRYCSAVQCPRMLWLKDNRPDLFDDSVFDENVMNTGNDVGDLAMGLFGDYVEVPFDLGLQGMVSRTRELLDAGTPVICEASFSYEGCFCSVDILRKVSGWYELYEVKSSTGVRDIYCDDVSYQVYVLRGCGLDVRKACLVHIDNTYVRHGDLELNKLFKIVDLTESVDAKQREVADRIAFLRDYMKQETEPACDVGDHCSAPYGCGFQAHCWPEMPSPNVFDLFDCKKKGKYYESGLVSFQDLYDSGILDWKQQQQVDHELHDLPPHIEAAEIREFMKCLSYPLYFLDFETFQPAVPLYDDSRPYQQIVFQYSLHWIESDGGELKHTEFLAYPGTDPRRALAEQLCRDIPLGVCSTAYNMGFEKSMIRGLAELYPDLGGHLMDIHDNMKDLMVPFQKRWYYNRGMQGSHSIKNVLPALFPDDPSMDYHNLDGVHNGGEASATFLAMQDMEGEELEKWRAHLLKYCGLDTFAMVKIWELLKNV